MALNLIKGTYRVAHSEPDGDSVHFIPDNSDAFTSLHLNARLGSGGAAQLRLDAIDALETHYTPSAHGAKTMHQRKARIEGERRDVGHARTPQNRRYFPAEN